MCHRSWATIGMATVLALALGACSTGGRQFGQMIESLEVDLRDNGSKLFVYRLEHPYADNTSRARVYRSAGDTPQREQPRDLEGRRTYLQLQRNTERALQQTGYCREGYFELDRRMSSTVLWLRGECREGASEEDRERFARKETLAIPKGR